MTTNDATIDEHRFVETVGAIRESPDQVRLQARAAGFAFRALCLAALSGVAATLGVMAMAIYAKTSPIVAVGAAATAALLAGRAFTRANYRVLEAAKVWKEQDQRNLLEAVRAAGSVWQLNLAGFFAYLPGTNASEPGFDESASLEILRKERSRMLAALSTDPSQWLEE